MSPEELEQLLAETVPDGKFGGPRPRPQPEQLQGPARRPPPRPVTDAEAAKHRADLLAALDGFACGTALAAHQAAAPPPRHLYAVPDTRKKAS